MNEPIAQFQADQATVRVYETKQYLGRAAAEHAIPLIQDAIRRRGEANLLFSAANSQLDMIAYLTATDAIDWKSVHAFHVDEYVGLGIDHPASFAGWVKRNVANKVLLGEVHYLRGDATDTRKECQRYTSLLTQNAIDVSFLGIGENGHIGFNDPHVADFSDPFVVKKVTLDTRCRLQQVGEGHWPDFSSVPVEGITVTCPALVNAPHIICCVPGSQKAEAVRDTLEGPVSPACPGSLLCTKSAAAIYLDVDSASLLRRSDGTDVAETVGVF